MKNIFLFLFVTGALLLAGCNASKKAADFFNTKCPGSSFVKQADGSYKVSVKCVDLYDTEAVKKYISEGKIQYDVVNAELYITGVSNDSIPDVLNILKAVVKGIKK